MSSKMVNATTEVLNLDLCANLKCKIISRAQIQWRQDANCCMLVFGNIRYDSESVNVEQLADLFLKADTFQDFYNQLAGQFFILIFDSALELLHLAVDQMGIQTCYYSKQNGCLYISESLDLIKNTEGIDCTVSKQAIFNYFYFHCIPAPATIYSECSKLEPGKAASFSPDGSVNFTSLFHPEFTSDYRNPLLQQTKCLDLIDDAVKGYVSRDCGAFLSGGLDSSTVAGMLSRHQPGARTFSIGFEAPDYDETPYAKLTAKHFGTQHDVLYLTAEHAAEEIVTIAQYFEEPFGNSSAMAAYFCAKFAKSHGVDSLLAGDGGDELFAGNSHYAKQKQFEMFCQAPTWLKSLLRSLFTNKALSRLPLFRKAASYINQADIPLPDRIEVYSFVHQFGVANMFSPDFLSQVNPDQPLLQQQSRYRECTSEDAVDRMLYFDWKFTLADNDLVKVKKMCELAGVAVHFPLLDKAVVDFSCEIPASVKLPGFKLRDFYKKACSGFLADATLTKSKHGFGLPFGLWMKENEQLMKLTIDCLESFRARNIVSDTLIDTALKSHRSVHAGYYGELIWLMVTLELWLQREVQ
jgi:asparagine synthase (glutamine-hydrolysing)